MGSGTCSHSIFYISVVLKGSQVSPKITCSYVAIYMQRVAMVNAHCAKIMLGTIIIVGRRKLRYA